MAHFDTQVCLWQCDWEGGKPNNNGVQHKSQRDSGQLLFFPLWLHFHTFSFPPWHIDTFFDCSEVQRETDWEPQSQQCTEADRGKIFWYISRPIVVSSFNFSRGQVRFAAAAIGNEEMACPAADREITNQIVVDWGNHNVDDVRKIKLSLDNGLSSVD